MGRQSSLAGYRHRSLILGDCKVQTVVWSPGKAVRCFSWSIILFAIVIATRFWTFGPFQSEPELWLPAFLPYSILSKTSPRNPNLAEPKSCDTILFARKWCMAGVINATPTLAEPTNFCQLCWRHQNDPPSEIKCQFRWLKAMMTDSHNAQIDFIQTPDPNIYLVKMSSLSVMARFVQQSYESVSPRNRTTNHLL